jgi:hypothetical protein
VRSDKFGSGRGTGPVRRSGKGVAQRGPTQATAWAAAWDSGITRDLAVPTPTHKPKRSLLFQSEQRMNRVGEGQGAAPNAATRWGAACMQCVPDWPTPDTIPPEDTHAHASRGSRARGYARKSFTLESKGRSGREGLRATACDSRRTRASEVTGGYQGTAHSLTALAFGRRARSGC